ncbi:MAG: alpha/beta hydrolase [Burkholderiales bacterium]|nr:alpha/beta hydrolase [Burkholderiales bacterium]
MSAARYQPDVKSATLVSGITLPYVESGPRDGLPVVFMHGYTDAWPSWQRVLPYLPNWMRALALTQRGHGLADKPSSGYSPQNMADDVADFMDAAQVGRAIIVGHSMGSVVAQHLAERHPHRVAGLVLVGAMRGYRGNPAVEELGTYIMALTDAPDEAFIREFQQSTVAQPVPHSFFEAMVAESKRVPGHVWRAAFLDFLAASPAREMDVPTLITWGDRDAVSPHADQMELVRMLTDARLLVYRGCGHSPHWEEPERFAADLAAFCHECTRQAGRAQLIEKEAA